MSMKHLLASAALVAGLAGATAALADTVIGTEDASNGFTGNLFESVAPGAGYLVASDGEAPFHPFGVTFDVSDGLNFSSVGFTWTQAADSFWTNIGTQTWVLPADLTSFGCGVENGTTCEPVGHFVSPSAWTPIALGTWDILDAEGGISDVIVTTNTAAGADLKFYSDPTFPGGVPEPATWAMMLLGFGGLGVMLRRKHVAATA
jgi:hypothetical protein